MKIKVQKRKTRPGTYHLYVEQVEWLRRLAKKNELSESEALRQILAQIIEKMEIEGAATA